MKDLGMRVLIAVGFVILYACTSAGEKGPNIANEEVGPLLLQAKADKIGKVEILKITLNVLPRRNLTPDDLEREWDYRFVIRHIDASRLSELISALNGAPIWHNSQGSDIRWGIFFYSLADDKRIGALYFDRWGQKGVVDNVDVLFDTKFFRHLMNALAPSLE